jgi:hypothetical protein
MKNTFLFLLLTGCWYVAHAGTNINDTPVLKAGVYYSHRSFEHNKPSDETDYKLIPFVRVNQLDRSYNDTLFRLFVNEADERKAFAIYNGTSLYIKTEDSLYRKMDYIGRFPFVTISNKIHFEEGYVIVNRSPVWKEERDEVHTYIAFVNKQGKLVPADLETMWSFLKGDKDLSEPFGKEKHVNDTYRKYIVLMNERYPL